MIVYDVSTGLPFDPDTVAGMSCLGCGRSIVFVALFRPDTDETRAAVLTLRKHPLTPGREPAMAIGLCKRHARWSPTRLAKAICAVVGTVAVQ